MHATHITLLQMICDEQAARKASSPQKRALGQDPGGGADFDKLYPGRRVSLELSSSAAGKGRGARENITPARFSAAIVDADDADAEKALRQCCVFLIPQVNLISRQCIQ